MIPFHGGCYGSTGCKHNHYKNQEIMNVQALDNKKGHYF